MFGIRLGWLKRETIFGQARYSQGRQGKFDEKGNSFEILTLLIVVAVVKPTYVDFPVHYYIKRMWSDLYVLLYIQAYSKYSQMLIMRDTVRISKELSPSVPLFRFFLLEN